MLGREQLEVSGGGGAVREGGGSRWRAQVGEGRRGSQSGPRREGGLEEGQDGKGGYRV